MSSKEERHFLYVLGGWAKLCIAQGAFVVAGIFAIAILAYDKMCDFSHAGKSTPISDCAHKAAPGARGVTKGCVVAA